jgi:CPA1 family monovalent cation:H+ antiporter
MLIAFIVSLVLVLVGKIFPSAPLQEFSHILNNMDFPDLLMGGMLNFLLFAGAIPIAMSDLKEQKLPVIIFSTLSVIISTFVIGFVLYYLLNFIFPMVHLHLEIPLVYCLIFGALISPTDPIAVLSILKNSNVPKSLEMKISGEALFNDGIAVVVVAVLLKAADGQSVDLSFINISWLLVKEAIGGLLVGLLLGYIGAKAEIGANEDYKVSVLITLSVVMGGTMIAHFMGISGPLTMVAAGLLMGNSKRRRVPGESQVAIFWELLEDIMNAVLFLLIGFELLLIPNLQNYWLIGIICIVTTLFARYISIKIPAVTLPLKEKFSHGAIIILVWGGLRGGVPIALALSLSDSPYKQIIIAATYFVVVFSIVIQGLTVGKIARKIKV